MKKQPIYTKTVLAIVKSKKTLATVTLGLDGELFRKEITAQRKHAIESFLENFIKNFTSNGEITLKKDTTGRINFGGELGEKVIVQVWDAADFSVEKDFEGAEFAKIVEV